MSIERMCRSCGTTFRQFTTVQNICGKCQYNKMLAIRKNSNAKPIKRIGKKAKAWVEERNQWIQDHPAKDGYWVCYLRTTALCPILLDIDQLTLDHVIPRSRGTKTEIKPACVYCNGDKGSQDLKIYLATHPRVK